MNGITHFTQIVAFCFCGLCVLAFAFDFSKIDLASYRLLSMSSASVAAFCMMSRKRAHSNMCPIDQNAKESITLIKQDKQETKQETENVMHIHCSQCQKNLMVVRRDVIVANELGTFCGRTCLENFKLSRDRNTLLRRIMNRSI